MGFDTPSEKLRICKNGTDTIELRSKISDEIDESETVLVKEFIDNVTLAPALHNLKLNQITVLDIAYCDLKDLTIAKLIPNLRHLGFSHNQLERVPTCLYNNWKYLESLDLSHNMIDHFDMEPECIQSIKKLKLNNNRMKWLPKWLTIFRCANLEQLNFSSNCATQYQYYRNSYNINIIQLRKLKLRNCHLLDVDYGFLKCFRKLEYLDISNNHKETLNKLDEVDDLFVKPKWKQLRVLKVNNLGLSMFPEGIAWLETLTELHITNNHISWLPDGMQYMVNLEVLDVSHNNLAAIPSFIVSLSYLRILLAHNNYIDGVPDFTLMPQLQTLDLYENSLDEITCNIETLQALDLECNYLNTTDLYPSESYEAKKSTLRKDTDYRVDGPIRKREDSFSSSSTRSSCSITNVEESDVSYSVIEQDDLENWDEPEPVKLRERNPDIDSEDEEWGGCEDSRVMKLVEVPREKVYVADEDWMFEDVEEFY